jgi:ribosomal protein S18 acetylase RimI-like enzyme
MSTFTIRPYQPGDLPAIGDVVLRAWTPYFDYLRERMGPELFAVVRGEDWAERKTQEIGKLCEEWPAWCLVAEVEGKIAGFVTYVIWEGRHTGEISNNAVDPDYQGQGLATALYQRVLDLFREQGLRWARVHTGLDPTHAPARTAYEKVGFTQRVTMVDYYMEL